MTDLPSLDPWDEALAQAWAAFCVGTTPIGAVVVDADGGLVASGRGRRSDDAPVPGQLSGTRIAHAEVNALAQLPFGRSYADHTLYSTVEPCCLCMGAAIQTGVGAVRFATADAYAGAASMMVDNPQMRHKRLVVGKPVEGTVGWRAGLLIAVHYELDVERSLDHVTSPWNQADPALFALASDRVVLELFRHARQEGLSVDAVFEQIDPGGERSNPVALP